MAWTKERIGSPLRDSRSRKSRWGSALQDALSGAQQAPQMRRARTRGSQAAGLGDGTGGGTPVTRVCSDGAGVPGPLLSAGAGRQEPPEAIAQGGTRGARGRPWMTPRMVGSAHRARGESDNRRLSGPAESSSVHMGDRPREAKERGRTGAALRPQSAQALGKSRRGQRPRRTGQPSPGRRATAEEGPHRRPLTHVKGGASRPRSSTKQRGSKASGAAAGCGESRRPGEHGGEGKTPFGCASCPYPLRTGGQWRVAARWSSQQSGGSPRR
jgi:hypothetical protein